MEQNKLIIRKDNLEEQKRYFERLREERKSNYWIFMFFIYLCIASITSFMIEILNSRLNQPFGIGLCFYALFLMFFFIQWINSKLDSRF